MLFLYWWVATRVFKSGTSTQGQNSTVRAPLPYGSPIHALMNTRTTHGRRRHCSSVCGFFIFYAFYVVETTLGKRQWAYLKTHRTHTYVSLIFLYELDTSGRAGICTFVHQTNLSGIHFNLNQNTGLIFFQTKVFRETGKSESVFCVLTCHKGSISININFLSKTYVSVSYSLD